MTSMNAEDEKILSYIEIEPHGPATSSIIWLHGLGADGNDFVPVVSELNLPKIGSVRFIFPHAHIIPVTINNGMQMRAWFDIKLLNFHAQIDQVGIAKSVKSIEKLIEHEVTRGIPTNRI